MILKYILLWLGLMILAIFNGLFREKIIRRFTGELAGHQISTLTLILLSALYVWFFSIIWPLESEGQALCIGGIWVGITVLFEFIFGHYVVKKSWEILFTDYNPLKGRIWLLILIWTFLAPWIFHVIAN